MRVTDNDLPPASISDLDLLRLIERVTRQPATLADAKAWRRSIERERARRVLRRIGRVPIMRSADIEAAHTAIFDMLMSPECQFMIGILLAGRSLAESLLDPAARRLYDGLLRTRIIIRDVRANIDGLHVYACEKMAVGGRRDMRGCDPAHALPAMALAALNTATVPALAGWRDLLSASRRSPETRVHLIARLRGIGAEICLTHPGLDVGHPLPGPPLGIWPPVPPDLALSADGLTAARHAPPGRR